MDWVNLKWINDHLGQSVFHQVKPSSFHDYISESIEWFLFLWLVWDKREIFEGNTEIVLHRVQENRIKKTCSKLVVVLCGRKGVRHNRAGNTAVECLNVFVSQSAVTIEDIGNGKCVLHRFCYILHCRCNCPFRCPHKWSFTARPPKDPSPCSSFSSVWIWIRSWVKTKS